MWKVVRRDDIDVSDGVFPDDGDGASDYWQIDEEVAANIMQDLEHEWAVALNEEQGDCNQHKQDREE
jgi:hypothetical protein